MQSQTAGIYQFDDVQADVNRLEVRRAGLLLDLEPKALRVLFYLIQHHQRVVTKDELLAEIWPGTFVTDNALTRVVAQLRKQLGDSARNPRYIETTATAGYRFIAPLLDPADAPPVRPASAVPVRSHRVLTLATASAVLLAAVLVWRFTPGRPDSLRLAGVHQVTTSTAADLWPSFSPDSSQLAFASNRSGVFELYIRSLAPGSADRQVTTDRQENIQPAWSPDGKYLAYVPHARGGIAMIPVSGGTPRAITDRGDTPVWSPDGKYLVFRDGSLDLNPAIETSGVSDTTLWIVGADGAGLRQLTRAGSPPGGHNYPRFSPDGRSVLFAVGSTHTSPSQTWAVEVATRTLHQIAPAAVGVRSPVLAQDGNTLFYAGVAGRNPGVWQFLIDRSKAPESIVPAAGGVPRDLVLSPDGKHLAFSQQAGESAIWSLRVNRDGLTAGAPEPLIRERSYRNSEPAFSPDGSHLAYASLRHDGEGAVYLADLSGANATAITTPDQQSGRPAWIGPTLPTPPSATASGCTGATRSPVVLCLSTSSSPSCTPTASNSRPTACMPLDTSPRLPDIRL